MRRNPEFHWVALPLLEGAGRAMGNSDHPQHRALQIGRLRHSREIEHNVRHQGRIRELPSRKALLEVLGGLCAVLFPTHYGRSDLNEANIDYFVGNQLHQTLR